MKEFLIKIRALFEGSAALKQVEQGLDQAKQKAFELTDALKLGAAIDVGGKIVEGLRRIPEILKEAVNQGMEFNRMMQNSQIGIAGGFRSVDPALSFGEAKEKGGEALDLLKQKALDLGLNFEALIDTFKVNVPIMWQAGIRDTQKMIDMITLLNQVAAAKGIDGFQAQRDIIDIMNGMGQRTILGKELEANGVSNESIKAAKEAGNLYELITTKLAAYGEAGKAASETQTAALNRLHTAWTSLMGTVTKPFFNEVTKSLNEISGALDKSSNVSFGQKIGFGIRGVIEDLKDLKKALAEINPAASIGGGKIVKEGLFAAGESMLPEWAQGLIEVEKHTGLFSNMVSDTIERGKDAVAAEQPAAAVHDPAADKAVAEAEKAAARQKALEREKDLNEAIATAEAAGRLKQLSPEDQLKELQKQRKDTDAWTRDPARSDDERDAGKKKELDLIKQIAELESKTKKSQKDTAAKREELDLELAINEAKASGNDKEAEKLKWQQDYNKILKERLDAEDPDAWNKAIRGANANEAGPIEKAKNSVHLSSLALSGHSVGESAQAAVVQPQIAKLDAIKTAAENTTKAVEKLVPIMQTIADKNGGYG